MKIIMLKEKSSQYNPKPTISPQQASLPLTVPHAGRSNSKPPPPRLRLHSSSQRRKANQGSQSDEELSGQLSRRPRAEHARWDFLFFLPWLHSLSFLLRAVSIRRGFVGFVGWRSARRVEAPRSRGRRVPGLTGLWLWARGGDTGAVVASGPGASAPIRSGVAVKGAVGVRFRVIRFSIAFSQGIRGFRGPRPVAILALLWWTLHRSRCAASRQRFDFVLCKSCVYFCDLFPAPCLAAVGVVSIQFYLCQCRCSFHSILHSYCTVWYIL